MPNRRITLVVSREPQLHWWQPNVMLVDSLTRMQSEVASHDVERIILDRCATADEYLDVLAWLPSQVAGDVLSVRDDGGAFLSATGRGGDRVLYALMPHDVRFYFETHGLSGSRDRLALIA